MLLYCFKYRKNTKSKNPKVTKTKTEEWCFYQNVQCLIEKKQNLSNSKTPQGY